jgi:hypothetical protein
MHKRIMHSIILHVENAEFEELKRRKEELRARTGRRQVSWYDFLLKKEGEGPGDRAPPTWSGADASGVVRGEDDLR